MTSLTLQADHFVCLSCHLKHDEQGDGQCLYCRGILGSIFVTNLTNIVSPPLITESSHDLTEGNL